MATFERKMSAGSETQKFSLRRLEPSIKKFLKVIEIDLDRLHQHQQNVEKFSRLGDWPSLNREQINASRTVQQIKANIKEIEKTRKQIQEEELEKFDEKTEEMKKRAIQSVMEFLDLGYSDKQSKTVGSESQNELTGFDENDLLLSRSDTDYSHNIPHSLPTISHLEQTQSYPENSQAQESWQNLHENLVELNSMIHEFSTAVQTQQEKVDRIEDNIEHAHDNVQQGVTQLSKASKLKAAMFPLAGAVIGGVVGGPVGLVAGLKVGAVAGGLGGAIVIGTALLVEVVGFAGGTIIRKRTEKVTEAEMKNLSNRHRSTSLPDISQSSKSGSSWLPWR